MSEPSNPSSDATRLAAKILGSLKSEKKAKASRENGKKGGRKPKKRDDSPLTDSDSSAKS